MGAVFVDDERSTAWLGTWHELGPCERSDAVGRALFERLSDAVVRASRAHPTDANGDAAVSYETATSAINNGATESGGVERSSAGTRPDKHYCQRGCENCASRTDCDGRAENCCELGYQSESESELKCEPLTGPRPTTLFLGIGLPKDCVAEVLVRAAGYELVEEAEGVGRSGWDGLTWTGMHCFSLSLPSLSLFLFLCAFVKFTI